MVDSGWWMVDGERRTVVGGWWSVDGGLWMVGCDRLSVDGGAWTADGSWWSVSVGGRCALVDDGALKVNSDRRGFQVVINSSGE